MRSASNKLHMKIAKNVANIVYIKKCILISLTKYHGNALEMMLRMESIL